MGREGYSIIGQGKIDEILSAKSGERREIFEEADRKSTRLNSSHSAKSRMPSSA